MSGGSVLRALIGRGHRRHVMHLIVHEASFAATIGFAGTILLLVIGTQILNWYWPVLLFAASLAVGIYRARKNILSDYQVAQSIDRRLGLHDTLSTAYFFDTHADRTHSPSEWVELQRSDAEAAARSADLHLGLPFSRPKTFYVNAALVLAAATMFGVRYGVNRSLDLRPSLVRISFEGFLGSPREIAGAKKQRHDRAFDQDGHRDQGPAVDPWESKSGDLDPAPASALETVDTPNVNNPDGGADPKSKATGEEKQSANEEATERSDKGEPSEAANDALSESSSSPDGSQAGKSAQQDSKQSGNSGENQSLTEKMRDALANLMAKLKMQPKSGSGTQSGSSKQNGAQSAQRQSQNQSANASSSSQQQSEASAEAQSQGQQQNGAQQSAQGKSDSHSADHPNSPDGKSGIGRQDGDKSAREAAQLEAMGKISEIIGKRAASVSGEVMVEVSSGKQQLKTQYSDRNATHVEAGGEVNRDEVPLAYQQYVQQYFEEIRKLPAAKGKQDPKAKTSGN